MPYHGILRSLRDKSLEKNWGCLYLYSVEKASMKEIGNLPSTSLSPSAEQSDSCHLGRQGPPCRGIMYLHAVDWLWPVKCGWKRYVSLQGESDECGLRVSFSFGQNDCQCSRWSSHIRLAVWVRYQSSGVVTAVLLSYSDSYVQYYLDFFPHIINPDFVVKYFKKFLMNSNHTYICMYVYVPVCMCVCVLSCVWLCGPLDCSPPGSSVCGIFQARILEPVAISYSSGSSWPRDRTQVSCISCIGRRILCHYAIWEACVYIWNIGRVGQKTCVGQWFPILELDTDTLWCTGQTCSLLHGVFQEINTR